METCWKCNDKKFIQEPVCGWCQDGVEHGSCDDSWDVEIPCDVCTNITGEQLDSLIYWAKKSSKLAGRRILTEQERQWATKVGVQNLDQVTIVEVESMPELPGSLKELANQYLNPQNAAGLTLDHAILLTDYNERLLKHEFRHVKQVEEHKSFESFLREYIRQLLTVGYQETEYEKDAILWSDVK